MVSETKEIRSHSPFEGIRYIEEVLNTPKFTLETGTVGTNGWERLDYFPKSGHLRRYFWHDGSISASIFNTRTYEYFDSSKNKEPDDIDNFKKQADRVVQHYKLSPIPYEIKYPEIEKIFIDGYDRGVIAPQELQQDEFYIMVYDGYREKSDYRLFKYDCIMQDSDENDKWYIYGQSTSELKGYGRIRLSRYSYTPERGEQRSSRLITALSRRADGLPEFYRVKPTEATLIANLLPPVIDWSADHETTFEAHLTRVSLLALQYTRWGVYQNEGPLKDNPLTTDENYRKAINILLNRFGEQIFIKTAKDIFVNNIKKLDNPELNPQRPYKPHTDIYPQHGEFMEMAQDTIKHVYPLSNDMSENGIVVNILPLCGDALFWQIIYSEHTRVYTELVQHIATLPDTIGTGTMDGSFIINPRRALKQYFPEAWKYIERGSPGIKIPEAPAIKVLRSTRTRNP